jgi:hypothetical protein
MKKITNVKTTVTLKKPFTYTYYGVTTTIPKGTKFNTKNFGHNGIVLILGHGAAEVIPHNYLGKYTKTYTVTEALFDGRNGFETVRKTVNEDVTKVWLAYWKKAAAKKAGAEARVDRINTKNRIAAIRKTIKYVKTGKAEKELALLLNHLAGLVA